MAWIELHDTLPDHPKVLAVAEELRLDKDAVVGKLARLWVWALNNREDGTFEGRDVRTVAEVMRFKGKAERLIAALLHARLLDQEGRTKSTTGTSGSGCCWNAGKTNGNIPSARTPCTVIGG